LGVQPRISPEKNDVRKKATREPKGAITLKGECKKKRNDHEKRKKILQEKNGGTCKKHLKGNQGAKMKGKTTGERVPFLTNGNRKRKRTNYPKVFSGKKRGRSWEGGKWYYARETQGEKRESREMGRGGSGLWENTGGGVGKKKNLERGAGWRDES